MKYLLTIRCAGESWDRYPTHLLTGDGARAWDTCVTICGTLRGMSKSEHKPALQKLTSFLAGIVVLAVIVVAMRWCKTEEKADPVAVQPSDLSPTGPTPEELEAAVRAMQANIAKAAEEEERREREEDRKKKRRRNLDEGTHYDPSHPKIPGLEYRGTR